MSELERAARAVVEVLDRDDGVVRVPPELAVALANLQNEAKKSAEGPDSCNWPLPSCCHQHYDAAALQQKVLVDPATVPQQRPFSDAAEVASVVHKLALTVLQLHAVVGCESPHPTTLTTAECCLLGARALLAQPTNVVPADLFDTPEEALERSANDALAKKCDDLTGALHRVAEFVNVLHSVKQSKEPVTPDTIATWIDQAITSDWRQVAKALGHEKVHIPSIQEDVARLKVRDSNLTFHTRNVMAVNEGLREEVAALENTLRQGCARCDERVKEVDLRTEVRDEHVESIFKDYMIEGDTTLRDVCARLTSANVALQREAQKARNLANALSTGEKDLADDTRDTLLVATASGIAALLKVAAGGEPNEAERATLQQMGENASTVVAAAVREMGL